MFHFPPVYGPVVSDSAPINFFGFTPEKSAKSKEAERTFTLFSDLPRDLRLHVYELAFPRRVLRFCEKWLPGHIGLVIEALGPPLIAQTCREAWDFSLVHYRRLPFNAGKLRDAGSDERPIESPPPKNTWFNPRVDVVCIGAKWHDIAYREMVWESDIVVRWGIARYNPRRVMHTDRRRRYQRATREINLL